MRPGEKLTEQDYLALESDSDTKHEFVNGDVIAMAGASPRHSVIVANVLVALRTRLRGCFVVGSDQRVRVDETGLYAYPDVAATCDPPQFRMSPRPGTLLNPSVVVEVLSESTEAWDRGAKAAHYRSRRSIREVVLVSQRERRVEVYRRVEEGWMLTEAVEGTIAIDTLGLALPLDEVYEGADALPGDEPEEKDAAR